MRLEYRIKDGVDVEAYLPLLRGFVANLRSHDSSTDYTAYRDAKDPHHFVHVGHFDPDIATAFQQLAWFKDFTAQLRERTVSAPDVVMLSQVS